MRTPFFSYTALLLSRQRVFAPLLILLLLWNLGASLAHSHHDEETPGTEVECQLCLHATKGKAWLPVVESKLAEITTYITATKIRTVSLFFLQHYKTQLARAPPR